MFPRARKTLQGRDYNLTVILDGLKLMLLWNIVMFPLLVKSVGRIWRFVSRLLTVCS